MRIDKSNTFTGACVPRHARTCSPDGGREHPPRGAAHWPSGNLPGDLPAGIRLPEAGPNLPAFCLPCVRGN